MSDKKELDWWIAREAKALPILQSSSGSYLLGKGGCGDAALALITGRRPSFFVKEREKRRLGSNYQPEAVVQVLTDLGYEVTEITRDLLFEVSNHVGELIGPAHVILIGAAVTRNVHSWFVMWNETLYHNFSTRSPELNPRTWINFPIAKQYLIFHPSWNDSEGDIHKLREDRRSADAEAQRVREESRRGLLT